MTKPLNGLISKLAAAATITLMLSPNLAKAWAQSNWPNSLILSTGGSGQDSRTAMAQLRMAVLDVHYLSIAVDQSIESLDGVELKTRGGSLAIGSDPIAEWSLEAGLEFSGIADQYSIREPRLRLTFAPYSLEGWDVAIEAQSASFIFANRPNILFSTSEVELQTRGLRIDSGFSFRSGFSVRAWYEKSELSPDFDEMDRPLLALVIPESAIATATSWAEERWGLGLGYARRKWGVYSRAETQRAKVSREISRTLSMSGDWRWSKRIWNSIRVSQSKSLTDTAAEPSGSVSIDLGVTF
jgi:hypothetical protein